MDRPRADRPRRRIPGWVRVLAVVLAVVLVAAVNTAAKKRQERNALAAADRVNATLLTAAGEAHDHGFEVTLLVLNGGRLPITVKAGRRLDPPLYEAMASEDRVIEPGSTEHLAVPFTARCPGPPEDPSETLKLVVPIATASGRVRDVSTPLETTMMWDLSRRACGFVPLADSVAPLARAVSATQYSVRFTFDVRNRTDRPIVIVNLTSPGLALSVRGGVSATLPPNALVPLAVTVALPACTSVPAFSPPGRNGALRFGTVALELRDVTGETTTVPYVPAATGDANDLLTALFALRTRICPGVGIPTSTRPRSG